jgi:hypothetical protein
LGYRRIWTRFVLGFLRSKKLAADANLLIEQAMRAAPGIDGVEVLPDCELELIVGHRPSGRWCLPAM